jgi:hypothetical protein
MPARGHLIRPGLLGFSSSHDADASSPFACSDYESQGRSSAGSAYVMRPASPSAFKDRNLEPLRSLIQVTTTLFSFRKKLLFDLRKPCPLAR